MNMMKKILMSLALVLAVTAIPVTAKAAATSPSKNNNVITAKNVKVSTATYNGKTQKPKVTVTVNGKKLRNNKDYLVQSVSRKNPGKSTIYIAGIGKYTGVVKKTFTVNKAAQKITVKGNKTVKAKTLKKKNQTFKLTVKRKGKAKVSYVTSNKKITVNSKGKVTLKKGLKKGTYTITIKTKATKYYKATSKKIKVKVK